MSSPARLGDRAEATIAPPPRATSARGGDDAAASGRATPDSRERSSRTARGLTTRASALRLFAFGQTRGGEVWGGGGKRGEFLVRGRFVGRGAAGGGGAGGGGGGARRGGGGGSAGRERSRPAAPTRSRSASTRAGATRRWTASAPRSPTRRRASSTAGRGRRATPTMRSLFDRRTRLGVPAPADRCLGLRRRPALHLRRRPGRADRLRPAALLDRPRPAQILPLLRRALPAQPEAQGHRDAVEPAGVDEDQRLAGRRPADRRPADLRRVRALPREVRAGLRGAGVPIYALTVQNEPQNRNPSGYPGTDMPVAQQAQVIAALGPLLQPAGPGRRSSATTTTGRPTPTTSPPPRPARTRRPTTRTSSCRTTAARWIAGTAYHCYSGDPSRQTELHSAFPDKGIWFTECSGSHGPTDPPAQFFSDTLKWHARNLVLGATRNWAKSVVNWNLALAPTAARTSAAATPAPAWSPSTPGRDREPERRVLHDRAPRALRRAGRGADRQHVVRHHRLERADHGRRLPQPRRLDGARRPQRERRPARRSPSRRATSPSTTRCPAARSPPSCGARTLDDGYRLLDPPAGPEPAVDDDAVTTWSGDTLDLDLGRTQRVRRVVLDTGAAARHRGAHLSATRRRALARRRRHGRRPAHHHRHPGDAGAVPARRAERARDGRGRADLPLRRRT